MTTQVSNKKLLRTHTKPPQKKYAQWRTLPITSLLDPRTTPDGPFFAGHGFLPPKSFWIKAKGEPRTLKNERMSARIGFSRRSTTSAASAVAAGAAFFFIMEAADSIATVVRAARAANQRPNGCQRAVRN